MADIEFVSELLIGILHGPQGGNAATIDEYYLIFEDYEDEFPAQKKTERIFNETLQDLNQILPGIKATRWGNKTDFYSLFVAISNLSRDLQLADASGACKALINFEKKVDKRMSDERAVVSREVTEYVRNVEKGANDKARRSARHAIVTSIIEPFYKSKKDKKA